MKPRLHINSTLKFLQLECAAPGVPCAVVWLQPERVRVRVTQRSPAAARVCLGRPFPQTPSGGHISHQGLQISPSRGHTPATRGQRPEAGSPRVAKHTDASPAPGPRCWEERELASSSRRAASLQRRESCPAREHVTMAGSARWSSSEAQMLLWLARVLTQEAGLAGSRALLPRGHGWRRAHHRRGNPNSAVHRGSQPEALVRA